MPLSGHSDGGNLEAVDRARLAQAAGVRNAVAEGDAYHADTCIFVLPQRVPPAERPEKTHTPPLGGGALPPPPPPF